MRRDSLVCLGLLLLIGIVVSQEVAGPQLSEDGRDPLSLLQVLTTKLGDLPVVRGVDEVADVISEALRQVSNLKSEINRQARRVNRNAKYVQRQLTQMSNVSTPEAFHKYAANLYKKSEVKLLAALSVTQETAENVTAAIQDLQSIPSDQLTARDPYLATMSSLNRLVTVLGTRAVQFRCGQQLTAAKAKQALANATTALAAAKQSATTASNNNVATAGRAPGTTAATSAGAAKASKRKTGVAKRLRDCPPGHRCKIVKRCKNPAGCKGGVLYGQIVVTVVEADGSKTTKVIPLSAEARKLALQARDKKGAVGRGARKAAKLGLKKLRRKLGKMAAKKLCKKNSCKNGGKCKVKVQKNGKMNVKCKCKAGFKGRRCGKKIKYCSPKNPCKNGGKCKDKVGSFKCKCKRGWGGKFCHKVKDVCVLSNPCLNSGICKTLKDKKGFALKSKPKKSKAKKAIKRQLKKLFSKKVAAIKKATASKVAASLKNLTVPGLPAQSAQAISGIVQNAIDVALKTVMSKLGDSASATNISKAVSQCIRTYKKSAISGLAQNPETKPVVVPTAAANATVASNTTATKKVLLEGDDAETIFADAETEFDMLVETEAAPAAETAQKDAKSTTDASKAKSKKEKSKKTKKAKKTKKSKKSKKSKKTPLWKKYQFKCTCPGGFTGRRCGTNIDDCVESPCKNRGKCVDGIQSYSCKCAAGWTGQNCTINIDDCASKPCKHGGVCTDLVANYSCVCPRGWTGQDCSANFNDCASKPCQNGGSCIDGFNSFVCKCAPGFTGPDCRVNVDDCATNPCVHGKCIDGVNSYKCKCPRGWTGARCEKNIDDCASRPCKNNGTCSDLVNNFKCTCPNGFTGKRCGKNIDDCASKPCKNAIKCIDRVANFTCKCLPGWAGKNCEKNINDCAGQPCWNGGSCEDLVNGFKCTCPKGFSGVHCETGVKCQTLKAPDHGFVSSNKPRYPARASYKCSPGFKLIGSKNRTCNADGTWTGLAPICKGKKCQALPKIPNGEFSRTNNGKYPSEVTYSCFPGFKLTEKPVRTCNPDQSWSGKEPKCVGIPCQKLPKSKNAIYSITNDGNYPAKATYTCNPGFVTQDANVISCKPDGSWSGRPPICSPRVCDDVPAIPHGTFSKSNNGRFPAKVKYTCDKGYVPKGPIVRSCKANGKWSGKATQCVGIACRPIRAPQFGKVKLTNDARYPASASYSCNTGFMLVGSSDRICKVDGSWTGSDPQCVGIKCPPLPPVTNGRISKSNKGRYPSTASYTCNAGYKPDIQPATRSCNELGSWSGRAISCIGISVKPAPAIKYGRVFVTSKTYPSSAIYKCDPGYVTSDSKKVKAQVDGSWAGTAPVCEPRECTKVETVLNGRVKYTNDRRYPSVAYFSCEEGFELSSKAPRKCNTEGKWSGSNPVCLGAKCEPLEAVRNAKFRKTNNGRFPATITYRCKKGYKLEGKRSRKCQRDGTWAGAAPKCKGIKCNILKAPKNATVDFSNDRRYPSEATYNCNGGLTLVGNRTRSCNPDGTWAGKAPECKSKKCAPLKAPVNGAFSISSKYFPSTATYTCNPGFRLSPSIAKNRQCGPDGEWQGDKPECVGRRIAAAPLIQGAQPAKVNSTKYPAEAVFECKSGYRIDGNATIFANTEGKWPTGGLPACVPVSCEKYPKVAGANAKLTARFFPANVTYECKKGYTMEGPSSLPCLPTGKYDASLKPVCKGKPCLTAPKKPTNGEVTVTTTSPQKAEFKCYPGYEISDPTPLVCSPDGKWDGSVPSCLAKCAKPAAPSDGNVTVSSPTYPSKANYTCAPGCVMVGQQVRECSDKGEWLGKAPECHCLTYRIKPLGRTNAISGASPEFTLYVNGVKVTSAPEERNGTAQAKAGQSLAVSVAKGSSNAFIGVFKFRGKQIRTGSKWQCTSELTSGWEENSFKPQGAAWNATVAGEPKDAWDGAKSIKAGSNLVFCRYVLPVVNATSTASTSVAKTLIEAEADVNTDEN